MGKKGVLVAAAFLSFWLSLSADSYRIMPNYGHLDSVVSLERDRERDTLISLGKDSGCLVVDLEQKRVLNRISLSGLPVRYNLNPVYPELALITEKEESFHLTLLNWQTGETLMERDEREMPYFLEYSRSGEFLLIGDGNIQFLSHDRGTAVEGPDGITDLLSFGYLGGSEKTFMGYSPSGSLIYYDRFTSQVKGRAETEEDLTDLTVLASDVRLLTARKGDTIMLINRQTGNILDTIEMENILSYHCQGDEDLITVLGRVDGEYTIGSYKIRKNRFSRESEKTFDADDYELTSALYAGGSYLMGTRDGTILTTGRRSRTIANLLTGNPLKISQLAMIDDRLILGNGSDELLIWESPFFEKELSPDYLLNLARKSVTVPLSEFRLASFSGKGVLWLPDNRTKYPYYLLSDDNTPVPLYEPEQNDPEDKPLAGFNREATFGFRELSFYDDLEVAMDEDKSCRVSRPNPEGRGIQPGRAVYLFPPRLWRQPPWFRRPSWPWAAIPISGGATASILPIFSQENRFLFPMTGRL